jgi:hypothetical protein
MNSGSQPVIPVLTTRHEIEWMAKGSTPLLTTLHAEHAEKNELTANLVF